LANVSYVRIILRNLHAVYEGGVLRPVEPLPLGEHQLVSIIILDDNPPEDDLMFEAPARFELLADHGVSLETVRRALSPIPGSLDADFRAERNER